MKSSIVVLTGAGCSAESGLATFRGIDGLWEGHAVEEVATPEAWAMNPELVWRFYQQRRKALQRVQPNPAHQALTQFESQLKQLGVPFTLITQNVDDLHDRVGSHPLHMHGELYVLRCENCGYRMREESYFDQERFLPCPSCEFSRLRPDIVWFGEMPYGMQRIEAVLASCTHFIASGTSGAVYPAAGFLAAARAKGANTFVNSLEEPANLDPRDQFLCGPATEVLPALCHRLFQEINQP